MQDSRIKILRARPSASHRPKAPSCSLHRPAALPSGADFVSKIRIPKPESLHNRLRKYMKKSGIFQNFMPIIFQARSETQTPIRKNTLRGSWRAVRVHRRREVGPRRPESVGERSRSGSAKIGRAPKTDRGGHSENTPAPVSYAKRFRQAEHESRIRPDYAETRKRPSQTDVIRRPSRTRRVRRPTSAGRPPCRRVPWRSWRCRRDSNRSAAPDSPVRHPTRSSRRSRTDR